MSLADSAPLGDRPASKDHWAECDPSQPAYKYRTVLDEVAQKLSQTGPVQYTRFKRDTSTVQILSDRNGLLASIFIFKRESGDAAMIGLREDIDQAIFVKELLLSIDFYPLNV